LSEKFTSSQDDNVERYAEVSLLFSGRLPCPSTSHAYMGTLRILGEQEGFLPACRLLLHRFMPSEFLLQRQNPLAFFGQAKVVQSHMRHSSIKLTLDTYGHLLDQDGSALWR
jgi:hypothetical protein